MTDTATNIGHVPFAIPGTLRTPRAKALRFEHAMQNLELIHWPQDRIEDPQYAAKLARIADLETHLAYEWVRERNYVPPPEPCLTHCFEVLFRRVPTEGERADGLWGYCLSCVPV